MSNELSSPNVKIFVCHTIDNKNILPENQLFFHILGGAALHNEKLIDLLSDATGENISEKNKSFCELTVQYWAWKNVTADYYGFCHYRRYFNFSDKMFKEDPFSHVIRPYLTKRTENEFNFGEDAANNIRTKILKYDCIVTTPFDTRVVNKQNVYEQYTEKPHLFKKDIDCLKCIVEEKYPLFVPAMEEAFSSHDLYMCNMFIMKKGLFLEYSEMLFDILFEFEKRTDISEYNCDSLRTIGHLGERVLNIFFVYLVQKGEYTLGKFQKVLFLNTEKPTMPKYLAGLIPVILSSNDYFAPYMSVMIQSIMTNSNSKKNYGFYVLHRNFSEFTKNQLRRQVENYQNFIIEFINVGSLFADYNLSTIKRPELTVETYFRLAIPDLFSDFEKVIYVDSDMICLCDISELYDVNLGNNWIASTKDIWAVQDFYKTPDVELRRERYQKLGIQQEGYFLAGLLVFNIPEFKKNISFELLMQMAQSMDWDYQDQDVLNVVCANKIHYLPLAWDFEFSSHPGYFPEDFFNKYHEAAESPKICHYAGGSKPWLWTAVPFSEFFWKYAIQTPYFGTIISRMIDAKADELRYSRMQKNNLKNIIKCVANIFFPMRTTRRKIIKSIYHKILSLIRTNQ